MLLEMVERKKERNPDARIENFVEVVVPKYSDNQFKEHFRMYPDAFEMKLSNGHTVRLNCNIWRPTLKMPVDFQEQLELWMVVSTRGLLFLDVHTGYVGSVADSRVFRNSPLHTLLTSNDSKLPLAFHLLGDSAYPLSTYMMVPFRDNGHLTPVEVKFNAVHSSTRSHVERAIGLLKGKWRRLRVELDMTNRMEVPNIIFAACVLHNFVILNNGIHYEDILMERNQRQNPPCEEVPPVTATEKRLTIAHSLM
nr:hypothetical protein BaRGS_010071 [Batillaria attramentaria]